ncbi:multidrug effflux MFS transporter [Pararhizobium haloflavum]|uniref:multidrug effflux MFS transporter n=1 Tax=Pararhizobium haloflavum TaxID=2037914 RepID=UPI003521AFAD
MTSRPGTPAADLPPERRMAPLGRHEFIAFVAALMALNAMSIDIMLPGLQQIGESLGVADENSRQLVLSAYVLGFGVAQLFFGPLADRFGRRKPLLAGLAIYVICAALAAFAPSFGLLLALRFTQGIGAAATRVIAVTLVRDIYGGRQMAEIMSMVMMVFMVVPVIAPGMGQIIMIFGEWHMIFVAIALFGLAVIAWAVPRLPETLDPDYRRELSLLRIVEGFKIVLTNRTAVGYAFATASIFGALFGFLNSAQQIYVEIYGLGVWFPAVFAFVALFMALSSFLNSRLVGRFGMRRLSHTALLGFIAVCGLWLLVSLAGTLPLWLFLTFFVAAMFQFGWIGANFNALAMEPLGHVAGTASSVLGFLQTAGGGIIGAMIGQLYNGTAVPMIAGFFTVSVLSLALVLFAEGGRLFAKSY